MQETKTHKSEVSQFAIRRAELEGFAERYAQREIARFPDRLRTARIFDEEFVCVADLDASEPRKVKRIVFQKVRDEMTEKFPGITFQESSYEMSPRLPGILPTREEQARYNAEKPTPRVTLLAKLPEKLAS